MTSITQPTLPYGGPDRRKGAGRDAWGWNRLRGKGHQPRAREDTERLARALGWFSIGLGLAELATPRTVARMVGVSDNRSNRKALIAIGIREIASGVGILTRPQLAGPVWTRVGGDVMDLALLGSAIKSENPNRGRLAAATATVIGVALVDVLAGRQLSRSPERGAATKPRARGIRVTRVVTLNRSPDEVYRFWRNFQNLPRFMDHLESVQVLSEQRSHWKARAPAGASVEWDAEIVDDRPNELIAWRSLDGADLPNSGSVRFTLAPAGGTEVRVELRYDPPGGAIGAATAKLFGEEPGQQVDRDLRRLKQVMETGEVVHSDASIHRGPHPARPTAAIL
jgi:uncharacterized membrane protein